MTAESVYRKSERTLLVDLVPPPRVHLVVGLSSVSNWPMDVGSR
jgi:hypothetical protein